MGHNGKSSITTVEVRANVSTAIAASADEPRLDIRQSNIIRPAIGAQRDVMPAMAVDQDAAQTHLAHFAESDLERPAVGTGLCVASRARHAAIKGRRRRESNYQSLGVRNASGLLRVAVAEKSSHQSSFCGEAGYFLTSRSRGPLLQALSSRNPRTLASERCGKRPDALARSQPSGRANREAKQARPIHIPLLCQLEPVADASGATRAQPR